MSTRKELELRVEELLASEKRLCERIAELQGGTYEPEPRDQRGAEAKQVWVAYATVSTDSDPASTAVGVFSSHELAKRQMDAWRRRWDGEGWAWDDHDIHCVELDVLNLETDYDFPLSDDEWRALGEEDKPCEA